MSHPGAPFPSLMSLSHSMVAGGTFTQHIDQRQYNHSGERPGYARLLQKVATSALHDSVHVVDPPKCHPNTRVAIIQSIIDWGLGKDEELNGKPILWLKGAAGAGKSAIARSVAERCSDEGLLLGTFFFGAGDPNRNHVEKLVATISYQISTVLPGFRDTVSSIIEDDMLIFDRSIRTQYVESPRQRPDQRLRAIFKLRPPFKDLPFTELDTLYRHIICKAEDLSTVLDIFAFPVLYGGFGTRDIELILELEQGDVEVMVAELHSIVATYDGRFVEFLHKSLADFLSEPQRSGDLYRDLSRAQLSHVARVIHIFSTHHGQETDTGYSMKLPLTDVLARLSDPGPNGVKADCVSSDIVQATRHFPMFKFTRPLLMYGYTEDQVSLIVDSLFLQPYLGYLKYIKDVCESTTSVYRETMRQYCECVLTVLNEQLSGNWRAHFVYAYYHLLSGVRHLLPQKFAYLDLAWDLGMDIGPFGNTIVRVMQRSSPENSCVDDIVKMSHHFVGDIKQAEIFAMSVCFCLVSLFDERTASRAAGRIYGISGNDRQKKRDHPWRWRQMVPRRHSFGDRLVMVLIRKLWHADFKIRLTTIKKAFQSTARYESNRIIIMREYFRLKSKLVPDTWPMDMKYQRPQQWPLYIFLLDLLPHILPLAGRYEPLVTMCRKKCFSSLSQFWPRKSRRARQAIESYLRRMDSEEECE
ncbi:hypothetical protein CPC08DRAFT_756270 [Agrocybe pediades]|nr:hypothetical protein CPC08DRAFT_756270 [Agrocybe pediades]